MKNRKGMSGIREKVSRGLKMHIRESSMTRTHTGMVYALDSRRYSSTLSGQVIKRDLRIDVNEIC